MGRRLPFFARARVPRRAIAVLAALPVLAATAASAAAQEPRFAVESVIGVDEFGGENVSNRPQIVIDVSAGVRLGENWQVYVRPWFRKPRPAAPTAFVPNPAIPKWDTELYQAGLRYQHSGFVSTRVDVGSIVSPIGLGLFDARPDQNPTIVPHLAYVVSMPLFDPAIPRQVPIANTYPLGALVTVSTDRWDARGAIVNSSPTRVYVIGADVNPRQTPIVEAGAGVTPFAALRLGVSAAHGVYAKAEDLTRPGIGDRAMTLVGGEAELAFGYTKVSAEIVRTSFETSTVGAVSYEWFVQGMQTLSPRWFVAARREGVSAPPLRTIVSVGRRPTFAMVETTAGFRVTRDVTLRGSYVARRFYNATAWDNQGGFSVVWASRWQ